MEALVISLDVRKPVFNKVADQPAHTCSLISDFVIRVLEKYSIKLATGEISIFFLVSVTEQAGLYLTLLETGFLVLQPK